jgi:integrase
MPKLTVAAVLKYAPQAKRREIRDALAPGLYLVIQPKPKGSKAWAMRFRRPDGKPAKLTLGSVDLSDKETADEPVLGGALTLGQARQLANEIDRKRKRGLDVIADYQTSKVVVARAAADRAANTFTIAARQFFAEYKTKKWKLRPRGWRDDARLLGLVYPPDCDPAKTEPEVIKGSLAERWRDKPVAELTDDDDDIFRVVAQARRDGIPGLPRHNKNTSDARGRKMHSALSVLFGWLKDERMVRSNPCINVPRPGPPPARERKLSEAEVRWFWKGCDCLGPPYGSLLKLLLLTGCRVAEVTGMRRLELGDDGATWTIPSERTKNHRPHLVPLAPLARAVLTATPQVESAAGYAFTYSGALLTGFSRIKAKLDAAMLAAAREEEATAVLPAWRLHDLRRTVSTMMHERLGIAPHVVEAVLNHVSGHKAGVAGTYNVAEYRAEKTAALDRWAAHVEGIVERRPANVVPIARGGERR